MNIVEIIIFLGLFFLVGIVWIMYCDMGEKLFPLFLTSFYTVLCAFGAYNLSVGTGAPEILLNKSKTYIILGSPIKSKNSNGYTVVLRDEKSKERIYHVDSIPPSGFRKAKTGNNEELFVPLI